MTVGVLYKLFTSNFTISHFPFFIFHSIVRLQA